MDRYIFFDPSRIPQGLHVLGIPTRSGLAWVEITEAEYQTATRNGEAAHRLVSYVREILAGRLAEFEERDNKAE